jgi:hypothetical protein
LNNQFWTGHDAKKTYSGKSDTQIINTIVRFSKKGNTTSVQPFLKGERTHVDSSGILVFNNHDVSYYDFPAMDDTTEAMRKIQLSTGIDTITGVENLPLERTDWMMYRIK